jgi:hypothetical protein
VDFQIEIKVNQVDSTNQRRNQSGIQKSSNKLKKKQELGMFGRKNVPRFESFEMNHWSSRIKMNLDGKLMSFFFKDIVHCVFCVSLLKLPFWSCDSGPWSKLTAQGRRRVARRFL